MALAIFDLDGTLMDGNLWRGIVAHHRERGIQRRWVWLYVGTHIPLYYLGRLGLVSEETWRTLWARDMPWTFRGLPLEEADAAFDRLLEAFVVPRLMPAAVARLQEHRRRGDRILLLSGSPQPLMERVARHLGAEAGLGTRWEVRDGRYTGRALPPVAQGKGKWTRLRLYLEEAGLEEAVLEEAWAYADSIHDRYVLERVGHPVAVNPDPALAALARERGWEVLRTKGMAEPADEA